MWNKVFTKQVEKKEVEDVVNLLEKADYLATLYQEFASTYHILHG